MSNSFSNLAAGLSPGIIGNLASLGYHEMTPIQAESLPHILSGKDVIGQARTGSGKTAAFGLGLISMLDTRIFDVQALVLCPTRELADQVAKAIRRLARATPNVKILSLCGGVPFRPQAASLEYGAHIVVGTPGRIEDHLRKQTLDLDAVKVLVLDEADRMLDMGFQDSIENIIEQIPQQRQTLLFSATFPDSIHSVASSVMQDPVIIDVAASHDSSTIEQHFYLVNDSADIRTNAVQLLLFQHSPTSAVVFCNMKKEVAKLVQQLVEAGFSALALHGDLEQRDRDSTLVRFANGSATVLVATDVAARGLDIESIDVVINFQLAHDPEAHVHRIGRTGRAGQLGRAFTLYSSRESHKIAALEELLRCSVEPESLPPSSLMSQQPAAAAMTTLRIDGGKKQKLRPGDILGALTGQHGIAGSDVGKIAIFDACAYVAVSSSSADTAVKKISRGKLKGRSFRAWII
ncbi:MAG: ATP-dependent RNA helicase DbpA [Gammaproteobacteria bacterium]|nr:ATP-dependent RNA helicase DbpA [Gammaproteobacteria bacterium]